LKLPKIVGAADVRNPLLGARGATQTYGQQKGASQQQLESLEGALRRLAEVATAELAIDIVNTPGAGAAGGLGFGLMRFCDATLARGFDVVAEYTSLEAQVREHDVIVTGEGRLDLQTLEGKAPAGVAALARKHGRPVYAIVGEAAALAESSQLFDAVASLARPPITAAEAIRNVRELLQLRARELATELPR
jgi:glycerate kinase